MSLHFLDTSAILNGALNLFENIYISPLVLQELEHIKSSGTNAHTQYLARQAVRDIITSRDYKYSAISQKQIDRLLKKYNFLSNINDHRMLCEALILNSDNQVVFVTSDGAQMLFAQELGLQTVYFGDLEEENTDYCGWSRHYPNEEQMANLYANPTLNSLGLKINEYAEIFEGTELKDVLVWTGEKYRPLKYSNIKNKFLGETIKPLNLEQKMAFDLLQNNEITVKLLQGLPGAGKDFIMLYHALDMIQRGEMDKIIFIRNLVPFKDAPEIGYIKGTLQEKIEWGLGPLLSLLGEEALTMFEEQGTIEAVNLGFIRGCSYDRAILYVSEGQNITGGGYKLLVSRCGKGSSLWINGDILQTDSKKFEKNNGLQRLLTSLGGNELFGTVKLIKTERSKTAELASII